MKQGLKPPVDTEILLNPDEVGIQLVFLMNSDAILMPSGADDLETLLEAVGLKLSPSQMEPRFAGSIRGVFRFCGRCHFKIKHPAKDSSEWWVIFQ